MTFTISCSRTAKISCLAASLAVLGAAAQANDTFADDLGAAELKRVYLACERHALAGPMGTGHAAGCSVVYEALKQRVFDGDFGRIRSWTDRMLRLPLTSEYVSVNPMS